MQGLIVFEPVPGDDILEQNGVKVAFDRLFFEHRILLQHDPGKAPEREVVVEVLFECYLSVQKRGPGIDRDTMKSEILPKRQRQDLDIQIPAAQSRTKLSTQQMGIGAGNIKATAAQFILFAYPLLPCRNVLHLVEHDDEIPGRFDVLQIDTFYLFEQGTHIEQPEPLIFEVDKKNVFDIDPLRNIPLDLVDQQR